jgi:putative cardiolipin synthase
MSQPVHAAPAAGDGRGVAGPGGPACGWKPRACRPWPVLFVLPLLAHCASAPRLEGVEKSHALPPAASTILDQMVLNRTGGGSGVSAVQLVQQNALAFAFRAGTAAAAERSLDLQYYIWHQDLTGRLLASELLRAAERGVRVRVLLDDMDARARHDVFLTADLHPNIEVRIFNPFYSRYGKLGKLAEFFVRGTRLNHRMHNKAWIADNRVAIVGGRNVGDEYFGASDQSNFSDTDLVLAGPVVEQVSREFDEYWNCPDAIPVSAFEGRKPTDTDLDQLLQESHEFRQEAQESSYIVALRDPARRAGLIAGAPRPLEVRDVRVLADDPSKVGTKEDGLRASQVLDGLSGVMRGTERELLLISPYLVPGKQGAQGLAAAAQRGIRVRALTNSLAATDVVAVHVGYARYRRELLKAGVELYEMKRSAGDAGGGKHVSVLGSKGASLHTKAMVVDARWSFVGSMNLDPRSANLNTEMGVLVDSPELAEQLRSQFEYNTSPDRSYHVVMDPRRGLVWHDRVNGEERELEREPDASVSRRMGATLLRALPIESQL